MASSATIKEMVARDVRFPTSFQKDGSDAIHPGPDYSMVYIELIPSSDEIPIGTGLSFTLGRGNELVLHAVDSLRFLVLGKEIKSIQDDMASWVRELNHDGQLRWVGPEKGVLSLAISGIINAFWDMWGKIEKKPVWKLVSDMTPEQIVSLIDFRYIVDCITKEEALEMLSKNVPFRKEREEMIKQKGYPAYTTAVGWLGYSDEKIVSLCNKFIDLGFNAFKMKVGKDLEDDKRRLRILRKTVGKEAKIAVDANQIWSVPEAIKWMEELAEFDIHWIEEPTSPDDVLGHLEISRALSKYGIGVATGEVCQNRVMFKQFLKSGAMQFCQIDSGRMSGLNEVLAVYLMAAKLGVPVCPHAGGVGLCEMVQHLQVIDYVCLTGSTENRMIEYVDHLKEHFLDPPIMGESCYFPPIAAGYGTEAKEDSLNDYEYPNGKIWKPLFETGKYVDPSLKCKKLYPTLN